MKPDVVREMYRRLQEQSPDPRSELEYTNPFELLVAVVLSAQATDVSVNKATARLYPVANTPEKILALGEDRLRDYIKTIGLYQTKARNVIALCRQLIERHGGQVPRDREALEALPGVGTKTANVVLNVAFGEPTIAVDTHIFRVSHRLGLAEAKTADQLSVKLEKLTPAEYRLHAHHWLILHGRYVCKARRPECWRCILADLCPYQPKTPDPAQVILGLPQTDSSPLAGEDAEAERKTKRSPSPSPALSTKGGKTKKFSAPPG